MNTFELHIRGEKCKVCCCPKEIHENCGGNWHCKVLDDDPEEGWIHNYKCDKCNQEEYYLGYDNQYYSIQFED